MTIRGTRIACWIPKATKTHSEYAILTALPLQLWLHERASVLSYSTLPLLYCVKEMIITIVVWVGVRESSLNCIIYIIVLL
jgi:hypothetical protein